MHNEKRLLCEFKLRRDRPLPGKVKIPQFQPQYVSQGHVLCQSRWRAGVGAGQFRYFNGTTSLHKDFVRGAQFLVTCSEEIVMATNNSGLDWNYLLVSEKRREREEEKGIE